MGACQVARVGAALYFRLLEAWICQQGPWLQECMSMGVL